MKNTFLLILSFFLIIGFTACEDEVALDFVAKEPTTDLTFTNSFLSEYAISKETENNIAERLVWEPLDFDAPVNVTYELQASTDPAFETFDVIGSTSETNIAVTVGDLLGMAEEMGLDNDPATAESNAGTAFFRLRAYTGTGGANSIEATSDIQPMNIRWIEVSGEEPPLRNLFLVGNATAAGWDPNNNNMPLFRDPSNPDVYYFTGKFGAGEFKLLEVKTQWQPQWGTNDGTTLAVNDGTGSDPGAFTIDTEGYYSLTVDIGNMAYTLEPYDASGATEFATIGIIGSATAGGWDSDTDLTQSTFDPHIWYVNDLVLSDGEMKFRANDAWDDNWGGSTSELSGQGQLGNPGNFTVSSGTYDVWFNDITGRFILIPQE